MIKLTDLDIEMILDEKPYNLDTAIINAEKMSLRYNKLFCVVKDNKEKRKVYHIIGFNYFRDNIAKFELYFITKK